MKTFYFLFSIALLFFLSCSNDEDPMVVVDPCEFVDCGEGNCINGTCECPDGYFGDNCQVRKLKKVTLDDSPFAEYTYSDNGRLLQRIFYNSSGNISNQYDYAVSGDTLIVTFTRPAANFTSYRKYFLSNQLEIQRLNFDENLSFQGSWIYNFFSECGLQQVTIFDSNQNMVSKSTVESLGGNCDYRQTTRDVNGVLTAVSIYNGDGKRSPYNTPLNYFIEFEIGNGEVREFGDLLNDPAGNTINSAASSLSEFTYNAQDYPASEVRTFYDGDIERYMFTYY